MKTADNIPKPKNYSMNKILYWTIFALVVVTIPVILKFIY